MLWGRLLTLCSAFGAVLLHLCCVCTNSLTSDGDVDTTLLTTDHNGMNQHEAARIMQQHSKYAR